TDWRSKWRNPIVRREASRTAAKASGSRSSRVSPSSSRLRNSAVFSGNCSGGRAWNSASSSLIRRTSGQTRLRTRSLALPKSRVSRLGIRAGVFWSRPGGESSRGLALDAHRRFYPGAEEALPDRDEAVGDVGHEEAR